VGGAAINRSGPFSGSYCPDGISRELPEYGLIKKVFRNSIFM
jgi:hypothetical protein